MSEERIREIFQRVIDAYRGRLTMKPNKRAERSIKRFEEEMEEAIRSLKEEIKNED